MIRFAVLGCGKICHRFIQGLALCQQGKLVGFGSRDPLKAKQYALDYGVDLYGTYQTILENQQVDAVYISTINSTHFELVEMALKAKKHVLCEKPMVESKEKYEQLYQLAKQQGVLLMEAIKGVFLPMNSKIKQMIQEKVLGEIIYVRASYMHNGQYPKQHWVNDPLTGGCLQDIGSYPASVVSFILDSKPAKVTKRMIYQDQTVAFGEVSVDYENGIKAQLVSSFMNPGVNELEVCGTVGYIRAKNYWKSDRFQWYPGTGKDLEMKEIIVEDFKTDFYYETQHFIDCLLAGKTQSDIINLDFCLNLLKLTDQQTY